MRRMFEFHCGECHVVFEKLVDSELSEVACKFCGATSHKIISAPVGVSQDASPPTRVKR